MSDIPGTQPMGMRCKCGHAWIVHLLTNVALNVWTTHVKSISCQKCGDGYKSLSMSWNLPVQQEAEEL